MRENWPKVKFSNAVKNANIVGGDSVAYGIECIVGLEHIDPENVHIQRWNSVEDVTIGWTLRENARAKIRVFVKHVLRCFSYPPDMERQPPNWFWNKPRFSIRNGPYHECSICSH